MTRLTRAALALFGVLLVIAAANLAPIQDEAYYWMWSQKLESMKEQVKDGPLAVGANPGGPESVVDLDAGERDGRESRLDLRRRS